MTKAIQNPHQIIKDPYRFVNLVLFFFAALCNSFPCQLFAGVSPAISHIYNLSGLQVNANSLFYPIMYVVLLLPANYIIDTKGIKLGTLICQFCMCLGITIRCLINYNYYFLLLGTFICSLGNSFTTATANKFPNIWFLDKQIFVAKSLILFGLFASDTLGFFLSTVFITKQSSKEQVQRFILIQSIILVSIHSLNAIFFREKPKSPQNYSSLVIRQEYLKSLKSLFKTKNYLKLFVSMGFVFADLTIIFVAIAWFGQAYNFSTSETGYILVIANGTGLIGCAFTGIFLKNQYKFKCKISLVGSFFSLIVMWIGFQAGKIWLVYVGAGLMGFNIFPFLTTLLDFAAQVAFPIGQATTGGSLTFGGQTFGFLMIILFSLFIGDDITLLKCRITGGVVLVFFIAGYIFLLLSKQDLKRKKYEQKVQVEQKVYLISERKYLED